MTVGPEQIQILFQSADHFGINLTDHQLGSFQTYLEELEFWNRKFNLTGLEDRSRMVIELFLDSLLPSPHLPSEGDLIGRQGISQQRLHLSDAQFIFVKFKR